MPVVLAVRNETVIRGCHRTAELKKIAAAVCRGEGVPGAVEISGFFCSDATIRSLNAQFGEKDEATDVLSFEQGGLHAPEGPRTLGDIVISLETVQRRCGGVKSAMRHEVRLLFCHGLLHLIGFDHDNAKSRKIMIRRQAEYLDCTEDEAWFRGH